ncbi:MAG TPA: hypothetical protein VK666_14875 [Chryseolinea sp.]|nr:hypothetical protein [Chryseolinea sp.]
MKGLYLLLSALMLMCSCAKHTTNERLSADTATIAPEMVDFVASANNPVFKGAGPGAWDELIRERGYILREGDQYYMWFTGYQDKKDAVMHLGYATSADGIHWTRYENNPIVDSGWVEDVSVTKLDNTYYMFAEGRDDIAHLLTSEDRVHWKEQGPLDIRMVSGNAISKGPYGTPTAWHEDNTWYLLYERGDLGVWLATSTDLKVWTNKLDEPVLIPGPEVYDNYGIAVNQVIKHKGLYYAYYHATAFEDWHAWSSCVATSLDLVHWTKYAKNPIQEENKSSPILVHDGEKYRLYTMHPEVNLHTSTLESPE